MEEVIPFAITKYTVVSANNSCITAKTNYTIMVFIGKTFVIYKGYFFCQGSLQKLLIMGLFFYSMGKEQVLFIGNKFFRRYFFNAHQHVAVAHVVRQRQAKR